MLNKSIPKSLPIFGPPRAWRKQDFTSSDDRVRGGSSQSYLEPSPALDSARFYGKLDTSTLGGAGFASQRTTSDHVWDLSSYAGIQLTYLKGDLRKYTLNIKTSIPEKMSNGRDASTVEYAYSFIAESHGASLWASWADFKPFYRGKPVDAKPLDTAHIMRWSIMLRSFFEMPGQVGEFSLTLASIKARRDAPGGDAEERDMLDEKPAGRQSLMKLCSIL